MGQESVLGVSPKLTSLPATAAAVDLKLYQRQASFSEGIHVHVSRTMSQTQTHTDSIDGQDHDEVQKKAKSRRPASKLTTFTLPKDRSTGTSKLCPVSDKASRFYRYCLPAAAVESMAVSGLRPRTCYISPLLPTTY